MKKLSISDINTDKLKAVIFDLDGTIYNKRGFALHMVVGNLLALPILIAERRTRKKMRGIWYGNADAFYDEYFSTMARNHIFTAGFARWWYFHNYMPLMRNVLQIFYKPEPWALQIMHHCMELQIPIAVYSDYGFVEEKLDALGVPSSLYTFAVSAPDLGGLKPCKQSSMLVINQLGVPAENCLFIGDRDDTEGAAAAKVGAMFLKC